MPLKEITGKAGALLALYVVAPVTADESVVAGNFLGGDKAVWTRPNQDKQARFRLEASNPCQLCFVVLVHSSGALSIVVVAAWM